MSKHKNGTKKSSSNGPLATRETTGLTTGRAFSQPSLLGYTPFNLMRRFADDMERMFEDLNEFRTPYLKSEFKFPSEFQTSIWTPKIEVLESNGDFVVRAELPGLKKEDIDIEISDNSIALSGERREEKKDEGEGYFRTERSYGSFYRSIPLPEGASTENAKATFENGVLEVKVAVPKRQINGRKLEIADAAAQERAKAANT